MIDMKSIRELLIDKRVGGQPASMKEKLKQCNLSAFRGDFRNEIPYFPLKEDMFLFTYLECQQGG